MTETICPVSKKVIYETRTKAIRAGKAIKMRSKIDCKTYECCFCGAWHLLAAPKKEVKFRIEKLRREA